MTLNSNKGSNFVSHVIEEMAGVLGITLRHATTQQAQATGVLERSHASIKQTLKMQVSKNPCGIITSLLRSLITTLLITQACFMDAFVIMSYIWNLGLVHLKHPYPIWKMLKTFSQKQKLSTKMVSKTLCKLTSNTIPFMTKKATVPKFKRTDYVYVLQAKADYQASKTVFTEFRLVRLYIIGKVLPNNTYFVQTFETNEVQVLHLMRWQQFIPRQPIPEAQTSPQEWKPDPNVRIKHDGFHARAWECQYGRPNFCYRIYSNAETRFARLSNPLKFSSWRNV